MGSVDVKRRLYSLDARERADIETCLAAALAEDPDVAFAYVHGSFLTSQPFHDIDVAVYLCDDTHGQKALALSQTLSERVSKPVDVRPLNEAPVSFVYHVMRGRRLFSRDDSLLAEVMERTVSRYLDAEPLLRQATREAFVR